MNKKGQTLVLFIILIPILIGMGAFVVDTGLVFAKKAHLKDVTKMVIKDTIKKNLNEEQVKELLVKNDVGIDKLKIEINDKVIVNNEIEVESIFGEIIGIKEYKIKLEMIGYQKEDKVIIE